MLVYVPVVWMMKVPVVEIVDVTFVSHGSVTATGSVDV
jgi:hypothetical protein